MLLHKLLERQIKKCFGDKSLHDASLLKFIAAVNDSYNSFERDKELFTHSFNISEKEYQEINASLLSESNLKKLSIRKLKDAIKKIDNDTEIKLDPESDDLLVIVDYLNEQINKRKEVEERLRDLSLVSEETSNMVIISDAGQKIEWVNKAFTHITGYTLEEVKGKKPGRILQGPDTDIKTTFEIREALNAGKSFNGILLNYSKNGTLYWNELSINPVKDAHGKVIKFISVATDATERLRKNEELFKSELKWKIAMEGSGGGVFEYDVEKKLFTGSDNLKLLLGLGTDIQFVDFDKIFSFIHNDDRERSVRAFVDFTAGKTSTFNQEFRLKNAAGFYVSVLAKAIPIKLYENGLPAHVLGTTTDITETKETALELLKTKSAMEKAAAYKDEFVATMSHEIRTPLNAIIGLTNFMLLQNPNKVLKENLDILSFSANNLLALITDILDLSKIEAGKIDIIKNDFSIHDLIKGVVQTFQIKCEEKNVLLNYFVDDNIPHLIIGDELRLAQILNNLVNNAVKFTDKGKISINVTIQRKKTNQLILKFDVHDTGIGIAQNKLKKIFDSFVQADHYTSQKYGGTGLGLAITKKLIELQGGKIFVESTAGKGSHFYFQLPFDYTENKIVTKGLHDKETAQNFLQDSSILLVEDILVNQKVAVSYLQHWGAATECANNGKEAIVLFSKYNFDLLLVDLYMPVMNGFDTIKKIRETAKGRTIPIVALTASAEARVMHRAITCGADVCLTKPFNANQLKEVLNNLLQKNDGSKKLKDIKLSRKKASSSISYKYINLRTLEDASHGNKDFIAEMLNVVLHEVPLIISKASVQLEEKKYIDFANSIHQLKNSMLMIGMDNMKETLANCESYARQKKKLKELQSLYSKIIKQWQKAVIEIEDAKKLPFTKSKKNKSVD